MGIKKILIIGGTRYIGLDFCKKMSHNKDYQLHSLSRKKIDGNCWRHHECDRNNIDKFNHVIQEINPDIIIDTICFNSIDIENINCLYNKKKLSNLKHYIILSSFFIYNHFDYKKFGEKNLEYTRKIESIKDSYTRNKILLEITLSKCQLRNISSILRLPFVFSSDDYTYRFQTLFNHKYNQSLHSYSFSMVSKSTVVESLFFLVGTNPSGVIDLANKGYTNFKNLFNLMEKISIQSIANFNQYTKDLYKIERNICIKTNKIPNVPNLSEELTKEALNYLGNS